jgi:hypothetical protein
MSMTQKKTASPKADKLQSLREQSLSNKQKNKNIGQVKKLKEDKKNKIK